MRPAGRWVATGFAAAIVAGLAFLRAAATSGDDQRVLLLGLDGATFTILDREIDRGHLPAFRRLFAEGVRAPLEAEVPYSPPSWTTIATGTGRETHGVDDFLVDDPSAAGGRRPTDRFDARVAPIWELLDREGVSYGVLGWLFTHPATETDVGWVDPYHDLQREGFPEGGYFGLLKGKTETFRERWERERPRFGAVVLFGPDKLQHVDAHWDAMEADDGTEPHAGKILRYYHWVDAWLETFLDEEGLTIVVVSDHGFRGWDPTESVTLTQDPFHLELNALLLDLGLLQLRPEAEWAPGPRLARRMLDAEIDWTRTSAFGVQHFLRSAAGIRVNLRGREPEGIVDPSRSDELIGRIRGAIASLASPDGWAPFRVVSRVPDPEPHQGDLELEGTPFPLEDAEAVLSREVSIGGRTAPLARYARMLHQSSFHDADGIFVLRGPAVRRSERLDRLSNRDVAPTLLYLLGRVVPSWMEGRIVAEAFRSGFVRRRKIADQLGLRAIEGDVDVSRTSAREPRDVDPAEIERLEEEMRRLGYIR